MREMVDAVMLDVGGLTRKKAEAAVRAVLSEGDGLHRVRMGSVQVYEGFEAVKIGSYYVDASDPENVKFAGTDMGPKPITVHHETLRYLVVRVPGHSFRSGVARRSYAPVSFKVLEKEKDWDRLAGKGTATQIVDFDQKRDRNNVFRR